MIDKPNISIILIGQLALQALPFHGNPVCKMPNDNAQKILGQMLRIVTVACLQPLQTNHCRQAQSRQPEPQPLR